MEALHRLETLVAILDRLRDPGGCPWDREQTYATLRGYLMEEAYEALDALDRVEEDGGSHLREELGDLLLQIVFLSRLAKEDGRFTIDDVVRGIAEKMIRRHPHVFGEETAEDSDEVLRNWERIKREEKGDAPRSALDGLPAALPALIRAQRLGDRAARVGFDWPDAPAVLDKVREELAELEREVDAGRRERAGEELGDLLFSLTMLARKLDVDPEAALAATNRKFRRRFARVEEAARAAGEPLESLGLERLEALWSRAKAEEPPA